MSFSDTLKELRIKNGFSQSQLAKTTGFSQSAIGYWERGEKTPSVNAVQKIAKALGVDVSDLIDVYAIDALDSSDVQKVEKEWKPIFEAIGYKVGQIYKGEVRGEPVVVVPLTKDGNEKEISFPNAEFDEIKKQAAEKQQHFIESRTKALLEFY